MAVVHIAGFDPGLTGGAALLRCESGVPPRIIKTLRFRSITGQGKAHKLVDARGIYEWLTRPPLVEVAVIEHVNAMPKQGVSSSFAFGRSTGALEALVIAVSGATTIEWVRPTTWKKAMHVTPDKHATMDRAGMLFGVEAAKVHWPLRLDSGVAEAALLARWYAVHKLGHQA